MDLGLIPATPITPPKDRPGPRACAESGAVFRRLPMSGVNGRPLRAVTFWNICQDPV